MKRISNELLKEDYYYIMLNNGLHVYLIPRPKFNRCYGLFSTKFGSCDQEFVPLNKDDFITVPAGVAHFLEHKTFEQENGIDASEIFANFGGEANAYTTYDKTVYMFTATSNITEQITTLLDFVQTPYFTKENVDKERKIIEQEVRMYLDRPQTSLYLNLLDNMYYMNYVKNDIGGTLESIKKIDVDTLYTCYNTFYHPSNMTFVLVGNFDLDKISEIISKNQDEKAYTSKPKIKRRYYLEDNKVNNKDTTSTFDVTRPKVGCGLKFSVLGEDPITIYKNMIVLDILIDMFFDESSDFYYQMLEKGIIDNSFSYNTYYEPTYAHVIFTVNTLNYQAFKTEIEKELLRIKDVKLDEKTFERYKKVELANSIARFNSIEYIANLILDLDALGLELFDSIDLKNNITLEDLNKFKTRFVHEAITFHTILPLKKENPHSL